MPDLLANLNERQLAAVTLPPQHALILAGAGSGKTRVLTTRIAWLISTGQASPASILAVTFTNKAAKEMLSRIGAQLPVSTRGMWVGTFHGLCNRFLRAHWRDAGLPQSFQILDSGDQLGLIKRLLKAAGVDEEKFPPRQLQWFINGAKEAGLRADRVEAHDDYSRRMAQLYAAYDEQCQREGVADFAELLLRSYELLTRNRALREHYQRRFSHILVDEFQDTNVLQYEWLKLLAGSGNVVFAVGDDDQSIYAFRGANVANMDAFKREFAVENLIKLEQNYRSHGNILDCANELIRHNGRRLGKELWTDSGAGEPVRVYEAMTDGQEAQWIVEEVRSLVAEGRARAEMAVLYRSNAQSRVLEHNLFSAGIPYRVYGGLRFFERAEIKHALAYLRLLENPNDDSAFLRVVNFPARGIGARSIEAAADAARAAGMSLYGAAPLLKGAAGQKLAAFVRLVESMRERTQQLSLPDTVAHVVEASGLVAHYQTEKEGQERIENLQELVNAATAFLLEQDIALDVPGNLGVTGSALPDRAERIRGDALRAGADAATQVDEALAAAAAAGATPDVAEVVLDADAQPRPTPLAAFLAHASLEAGENQAGEGADALQMMTAHAAKGLEFDVVFVTGLEEGLFPHDNSANDPGGVEEERRLMYVAITRARRRLYLSFSQTRLLHGQTRYNLRSRFLDELPEDSLKWLTPRVRPQAASPGRWGSGWGSGRDDAGRGPRGLPPPPGLPAAPQAAGTGRPGVPWRVGQSVAHARFGEGVIVGIEGSGPDARVQINFGPQGLKWLALGVAKLEAV